MDQFIRTALLLGTAGMNRLSRAHVAVFGIGGVGGYVCEALVRSGVGTFDLIDRDVISESNLNRQIIALHSTIGQYKAEVMRARMLDINPSARVTARNCFALPENMNDFPWESYDYVVDAVDTVKAKLALVMTAREKGVPIISSMGAGNKLDGSRFRVSDISETSVCPLARVMRKELRRRGVEHLKVVWSDEDAFRPDPGMLAEITNDPGRRDTPGSTAFVPSVAGLLIAGEVVRDLTRGCARVDGTRP